MAENPKVNSKGQQELAKVQDQFDKFDEQVKSLTQDECSKVAIADYEPQTKLSNREMNKADAVYLKPNRSIGCRAPFNEKFRQHWNEAKQYVRCMVENLEIIGENITCWSKPFAGVPYEEWIVPVNKPIMIPRHLADQLASRYYHRFVMDQSVTAGSDGNGTYYGAMAVKETRRRIDCRPVGFGFVSMAS